MSNDHLPYSPHLPYPPLRFKAWVRRTTAAR